MATVAELEFALTRLKAGVIEAVILQSGDFYVQAAKDGPERFVLEAVSDEFLRSRLTPDQLRRLIDLKFAPPGRNGSPNHWQTATADVSAAAGVLVEALSTVYGAGLEAASVALV